MSRTWLSALLSTIILAAPLAAQAPKEAPKSPPKKVETTTNAEHYKDTKVGDWVQYKVTGGPQEMLMKQSVISKTADEMVVRYEMSLGSQQMPTNDTKINLKEKHDPNRPPSLPADVKVNVEKLGTGKETLSIGGRKYESVWSRNKVTMDGPLGKFVTTSKAWISKDVPLEGLVKTESETEGANMPKTTSVTELVSFGRGK